MKISSILFAVCGLLLIPTAWGATAPAPQLPNTCPDLSKNGMFNPLYWQIQLQPLANAGQLQTNMQVTQMQGNFQSVIWSHYVVCNYTNAAQGNFSLKSKFITTQPPLPSASTLNVAGQHWQMAGYVIVCTSADPRDCVFQATYLMPQTPPQQQPSDLQIQQSDSLPHAPIN